MSEQLEEQLYKAKASLALLIEGVEYSDNYGVHGSDFMCCHLCSGGGAPGIPLVHDKDCPVSRVEVPATEWWDEEKIRRDELSEAKATISRLTAERDEAKQAHVDLFGMYTEALKERDGLKTALEQIADAHKLEVDGVGIDRLVNLVDRIRSVAKTALSNLATPAVSDAPGHTDLMVTPESIDAWLEKNPLTSDDPDADGARG